MRVLDVFMYMGGFVIYVVVVGVDEVVVVDKLLWVINMVKENVKLNGVEDKMKYIVGLVFFVMEEMIKRGEKFDIVIFDFFVFVQYEKDLKCGFRVYFNVNYVGFQLVKEGGILVIVFCFQYVDLQIFKDMVIVVVVKVGKFFKMFELYRMQVLDYLILMVLKDIEYLKVFFFYVEDMK